MRPSRQRRAWRAPPEAARRSGIPASLRTPGQGALLAFLRRPESYPEPTRAVEALETHMSWVFLTERDAYKLKKPFRRGRIDYTTAAARHRSCLRELRLNRRLAPDVYLDVVALTVDGNGRLALGGVGRRIDWLVRMRRLPADLSLERRLLERQAGPDMARRIVARLIPFYAGAAHARWTPAGYRRHLLSAVEGAARDLARPEYGLARAGTDAVARALREFAARHRDLLDARVRGARIVEGHGDLRPEHIYLSDPPTIIDCIEFDRGLRLRDPVDELAFLSMECDRLGCPGFDAWLFDSYADLTGDHPPRTLVEFHKGHSAFVRAAIAITHLDDADTGPREYWTARAQAYLQQARGYLDRG